jgi:hypothetical protein
LWKDSTRLSTEDSIKPSWLASRNSDAAQKVLQRLHICCHTHVVGQGISAPDCSLDKYYCEFDPRQAFFDAFDPGGRRNSIVVLPSSRRFKKFQLKYLSSPSFINSTILGMV